MVTEEVQSGAPSRRVNATFTAYGDHLWLIGGGEYVTTETSLCSLRAGTVLVESNDTDRITFIEYFDGGKAYF